LSNPRKEAEPRFEFEPVDISLLPRGRMTWPNDRRKMRAIFLLWLLIAIFWTLVVFDVVPKIRHSQGPLPWFWLVTAWIVVFSWGSKLRRLPRRREKQITSKTD
jgi:hypothetical protein